MESTVKRHEKIRDFILYEVMVARFTAYHCVCMQMQQTQKGYGTTKIFIPLKKPNYYVFKVTKYIFHHVNQFYPLKCSFLFYSKSCPKSSM